MMRSSLTAAVSLAALAIGCGGGDDSDDQKQPTEAAQLTEAESQSVLQANLDINFYCLERLGQEVGRGGGSGDRAKAEGAVEALENAYRKAPNATVRTKDNSRLTVRQAVSEAADTLGRECDPELASSLDALTGG